MASNAVPVADGTGSGGQSPAALSARKKYEKTRQAKIVASTRISTTVAHQPCEREPVIDTGRSMTCANGTGG